VTKALMVAAALLATGVRAEGIAGETKRTMFVDAKVGLWTPLIDDSFPSVPADKRPYQKAFGGQPMLMGEGSLEYELFQQLGVLSTGLGIAYAEKFGHAVSDTGTPEAQSTGLRVFQFKALLDYHFDYAATHWQVPLVPSLKLSLIAAPWWATKGDAIEFADGLPGNGVKYGFGGTVGLALLLDFLDPRLARDFDTGLGVNHTYFFGEFAYQNVTWGESPVPLDLSSRHWMFGFAFDI